MRQAIVDIPNNIITIQFREPTQSDWMNTLSIVKSLAGRIFIAKSKQWAAPALKENIEILNTAGFEFPGYELNPIAVEEEKPWLNIPIEDEYKKDLRNSTCFMASSV